MMKSSTLSGEYMRKECGLTNNLGIDYGTVKGLPVSSAQWQIPVGLQLLPPAVLGLGLFGFPESVRWLVKKGRVEEAWDSLTWMRADDGEQSLTFTLKLAVIGTNPLLSKFQVQK